MNSVQSFGHVPSMPQQPRGASASVEAFEDVLYDILATGVDPGSAPGTLEAVQFFLHEHARAPKSRAEMTAFFDAHNIGYVKDLRPALDASFALPPIETPAAISGSPQRAAPARRPFNPWIWLASACALSLTIIGAAFAYATVTNMRAEIAQVRDTTATQAAALAAANAEAATLKTTLADNTKLMQSVDKKSELLLQTLVSPLDPAAR